MPVTTAVINFSHTNKSWPLFTPLSLKPSKTETARDTNRRWKNLCWQSNPFTNWWSLHQTGIDLPTLPQHLPLKQWVSFQRYCGIRWQKVHLFGDAEKVFWWWKVHLFSEIDWESKAIAKSNTSWCVGEIQKKSVTLFICENNIVLGWVVLGFLTADSVISLHCKSGKCF